MLDFPFWGATTVYSLILIVSVIVFLKNYRDAAMYALPVFLVTSMYPSEGLIRQFLAIPFLFFAILFLMKDELLKCLLSFFCATLVHLSSAIVFPFLLLFYYVKIPIKSSVYLIAFYFFIFFFWKIEYWDKYVKYMNFFLDNGITYSGYIHNAEQWFSSEGSLSARGFTKAVSSIHQWISLVKNSILVYFGFNLLERIRNFKIPFYFFYLSIIILTMASDIEVIYRIGKWFDAIEFFVAGMVLVHFKYIASKQPFTKIAFFLLVINYIGAYMMPLNGILTMGVNKCLFIWNVN
jgi:hypothetical protein